MVTCFEFVVHNLQTKISGKLLLYLHLSFVKNKDWGRGRGRGVLIEDLRYMTESASGQDKGNPMFRLVTQADKISPHCPLGISHFGPTRISSSSGHTTNSLLTHKHEVKISGYFYVFIDLDFISLRKYTKKNLANIQPSWSV